MSVDTLLNFNGANGSAVFTDDGLDPLTFSTLDGTPVLSTATKKFGNASLSLDGSSSIIATPVVFPLIWTVECWFNLSVLPALNQHFCIFNLGTNSRTGLFVQNLAAGALLVSGSGGQLENDPDTGAIETGVWYHVAMVSDGISIRSFIDGKKIDRVQSEVSAFLTLIQIGSYQPLGIENLNGFIDGFRITRNEQLYNVKSGFSGRPTSELTTTTVSPPALPSDHGLIISSLSTAILAQNKPIVPRLDHTLVGGGSSGTPVDPPATSTNIISGNVKKLGLPFGASVACVSIGVNAEVVGTGVSDPITGDYSIDVYPHTEETLIYVAPEYGSVFTPSTFVGLDQIIHPTIPNRYVYVVTTAGTTDSTEPNFPTEGLINSGSATFNTLPLHRPLMNGFIKPVITPI